MKLEYDINISSITNNTMSSVVQPLEGEYPIVTFGKSNYRTGSLEVLPLSMSTINYMGQKIDKLAEQVNRDKWIDFLNNGKAKVIRMDSGTLMLVVTHNAQSTHRTGDIMRDLADIAFDFTEIGKLTFDNLKKNDLIANAYMHKSTFNDEGGIVGG